VVTLALSDFEIGKIAEIVAGRVGANLDAKSLRRVVDSVVDAMQQQRGNPEITGATCEVSSTSSIKQPEGPSSPIRKTTTSPLPPDEQLTQPEGGLYEQIEKGDKTRIIIAAFGKDRPGVVAAITSTLAELNCSIEDISQTLMQEFFSMIMVVNISGCPIDFDALRDKIKAAETQLGMKVYIMHEDIFQYMHRI